MTAEPERSDLLRRALENARRLGEELRRQQEDLARVIPAAAEGGQALQAAAAAAERIVRVLGGASGIDPSEIEKTP